MPNDLWEYILVFEALIKSLSSYIFDKVIISSP